MLKGGEPIYLKKSKKILCILIHGWTSTPHEVRELSYYLAHKGYSVEAPLLKGHGSVPSDLKNVCWQDWYEQIDTLFKKRKKQFDHIIIGGSSIGANLALMVGARTHPKAIIALGASIYLRNFRFIKTVLPILAKFKKTFYKRYPRSVNMRLIKRKVHYWEYPTESLVEIVRSMIETEKSLSDISAPTLIMQSATDHILPRKNAEDIYYRVASNVKRLIFVPNSYHVFTIDRWRRLAFAEIYKFIKQVL